MTKRGVEPNLSCYVLSWLLTCSLGAEKDRIFSRESPGWNWRRSASICLVLQGKTG